MMCLTILISSLQYRDHTPAEYEPEYFSPAPLGAFRGLHKMPLVINVGNVKTNSLEMRVKYAGLESFLFEDLCKFSDTITPPATAPKEGVSGGGSNSVSADQQPSTCAARGSSVFQGTAHGGSKEGPPVSAEQDQGSLLARDLSKVKVSSNGPTSDLANEGAGADPNHQTVSANDEVFKEVKQFL